MSFARNEGPPGGRGSVRAIAGDLRSGDRAGSGDPRPTGSGDRAGSGDSRPTDSPPRAFPDRGSPGGAPSRGRGGRFRPLGLRMKLSLWASLVLAASLGAGFAWVHHGLGRVLEERNDAFLARKAAELLAAANGQHPGGA